MLSLYAECHYAECLYAECHCAECHDASFLPFEKTNLGASLIFHLVLDSNWSCSTILLFPWLYDIFPPQKLTEHHLIHHLLLVNLSDITSFYN